ncbi:hypothetical protein VPNG_01976 [Cytospora leucostoma]|uniref:Uncharacterized protein n=1 Tax=Cytospora leucostoma TaxID=1230097 RepID=A0A423XJ32_9PEZI|nr:hypothetical protein VPNG_01976 [Cytospora leucostoma]
MVLSDINPNFPTFTTPDRPLTWLITGCSSGFGLEIARQAQANGHRVIATSRNPSKTPELVQEIESKGGKWTKLDLDDPNNANVIHELEATGWHIGVLVNNAGYSLLQVAEHAREDEVRAQFETVFFGPYRITRAVLSYMRSRRFGIIVNISSGSGLEARETMGVYGAAKAAFDGVTKTIAREVAEFNVRTLTVLLGAFSTPMVTNAAAGKESIAKDYEGKLAGKVLELMHGGKFVADGDALKGAKAVYEVVMGEGVGAGKVGEPFLPLGRDMEARVKLVRDRLDHCWEAFGDIATNVYGEN